MKTPSTAQVRPVADPEPDIAEAPARVPPWRRVIAWVLKTVIPIAIVAAAAMVGWKLYLSAPVAGRTPHPHVSRLVEVVEVQPRTQGPMIEAWGEVEAGRTLALRPELGGTVVALSPQLTAGGLVKRGELLIRLDDRDAALAVAWAEAQIAEIEARIAQEEGQQARARHDLQRLTGTLTESQRSLVLRGPQMAGLKAELAAAEAARDQAGVALSHTVIRAPFDAVVISQQVAMGAVLTTGSEAAELIATDRFDLMLAVPVAALESVDPAAGQVVRLTQPGVWPAGSFREGRVERLAAGLRTTGRMAELVVSVADPLARLPENAGKPRLLLGSFLRADLAGRPVDGAVALDRAYLHDGDTVWVMNADDKLDIRPVEVAWRGAEQVLVGAGLAPGDRVVTTPLAVVVPGMALRLRDGAAGGAAGG